MRACSSKTKYRFQANGLVVPHFSLRRGCVVCGRCVIVPVPLAGSIGSRQMAWSFQDPRTKWVLSTVVVAQKCQFSQQEVSMGGKWPSRFRILAKKGTPTYSATVHQGVCESKIWLRTSIPEPRPKFHPISIQQLGFKDPRRRHSSAHYSASIFIFCFK